MAVTIGVLLPVRIETRFYPKRLRVRVIPDEPWFARHDPRVSAGELDALRRFVAAPSSTEPEREQAWRDLAAAVGGPRAAYLARTQIRTAPDGSTTVVDVPEDQLRVEPAFPRIAGFPETLHVWLARGGGAPVEVLTLAVDANRLRLDFPDPDAPGERRWWERWDEAVKAGLAGEVELPGDPTNIDALYVTALGDGKPAELFADHRDAGRLGLLAPGEPTNTVDGAPAASFGQDPLAWRRVLLDPPTDTDRAVSAALTGDPATLGPLPGTSEPHERWNAAMVAGLWPALWGFAAEDVWALPPDGIPDALCPEGPFPTLRVGSQPYGLLPASVPERWVAAPKDPTEAELAGPLVQLRDGYAAAAQSRGTVVGASTDTLLDLIGQLPTSPVFRHRLAWPLEVWWLVLLALGYGVSWSDLDRAWHDRHPQADEFGLRPARRYGTTGTPQRLGMPLVVPDKLPGGTAVGDVLKRLVEIAWKSPWIYSNTDVLIRELLKVPPDSLLLRLAIRAIQVALGDVGRTLAGATPPGPEPIAREAGASGQLQQWISTVSVAALTAPTPPARRFAAVADGLLTLTEVPVPRLERLLRATVDTAAYRIDPWLVGPPTRRLRDLVSSGAEPRLGAFGWVDAPRPGTPGPTAAGMIHTPSPTQALVATVLRDRSVNDGSARWDLDLTSQNVRDADRIAEHVRVGAHLAEALGREVERIVARPADVERLRRDYPVRTEHAGRRVCDGLAVLAAPPASLGLDPARLAGLDRLRAAMDAYGDILVAEAVHHVTEGRAEVAGAVMDAAAGLGRPPQLGVLRTPRAGRSVLTSVVVALRAVEPPAVPADPLDAVTLGPGTLADPSTAAFIADQLGDAPLWTFDTDAGTVSLADLGLSPADALALSRTDLARLAGGGAPVTGGTGLARYEAAARLVAVLGRRPAGPDALRERAETATDPTPADADLLARYTRVRDTGAALVSRLSAELGAAEPDLAVLDRLVVAARRWGVAPDPPPGATIVEVATRAVDVLGARVNAAPPPSPAVALDDLVAALAALVSPTGQLAVTGTLPAGSLPQPSFVDDAWLPVISAVREPLARVEAHQLAAGTPAGAGPALAARTNKPADPWQTDPADGRCLVVAYTGPGISAADASVAVAAIDRFAEVVPDEEQTTAATFGFDAPAARAAQAILLAVPPDITKPLDEETVVRIVAGTRRLARARVARPADLRTDRTAGLSGLLPAALLPASGPTAVPL